MENRKKTVQERGRARREKRNNRETETRIQTIKKETEKKKANSRKREIVTKNTSD